MSRYDARSPKPVESNGQVGPQELGPGKQTLVEQIRVPVQQKADARGDAALRDSAWASMIQMVRGSEPTEGAGGVHAAAAQGVATPSGPLPHGDTIQRAFGHHDISSIQAHTGPAAAASASAMGADAYATGDHVVLGRGTDLHTVAHEAAHVVQQRGGVQLKGGVGAAGDPYERHADAVADAVVAGESAAPLLDQMSGSAAAGAAVQRAPATGAAGAGGAQTAPAAGMWEHTFGEASTPVGKLGRVQAPKGVYLRERPLPGAPSPGSPVPFNGLVYVERRTNQGHANERWCYVVATEHGTAGFCEERYLAIDPPEPTARLRPTAAGERLAVIAEHAYGVATDDNNSRLYVQALYLANRDRAGVRLDHVDLSFKDRAVRGEDERHTLEIYKGATVIAGNSLWIPSRPFIDQLKAAGTITGGSGSIAGVWGTAKEAVGGAVDVAKYTAGFVVGTLEGAYNAIVDLFKGAVDMVEAVFKVVWNLVTGNLGAIKAMLMGWVDKMKLAWEHRGEIADEFLKKWNAESSWDRGLFQGDVLGWLMMTVLLILVTMGEDAPAALAGIAVRWPQLVKLIKTVDTLGDVTTYLGAAAKAIKLPMQAVKGAARDVAKGERAAAKAVKAGAEGENELAKLGTVMANKGSRLVHTTRAQAMHELLEEARRANVVIHSDEEAQRLLDWAARTAGAESHTFHAVTIGDDIFVRPEHLANVRVLREELIHVFQQRAGVSSAEIVQKEIEARLMMIRYRHRWGITVDEIREMIMEVRTMRNTGRY